MRMLCMYHRSEQLHVKSRMAEPLLQSVVLGISALAVNASVGELLVRWSEEIKVVEKHSREISLEEEEDEERWKSRDPFERSESELETDR